MRFEKQRARYYNSERPALSRKSSPSLKLPRAAADANQLDVQALVEKIADFLWRSTSLPTNQRNWTGLTTKE